MKLPLAVDIADTVRQAHTKSDALDSSSLARQLLADHPEADATAEEVAEVLEEELPPSASTDEV